jgi:serine/threonine protein kinase
LARTNYGEVAPKPEDDSMMIGTMLGPYRVVEKLGEGEMGRVYLAHDTRLQRDVAIKVLPDSFAGAADRLMRFEREAQTLAALNHPNMEVVTNWANELKRLAPAVAR